MGLWALLSRSLRIDARGLWTNLLRLGAILVGYLALVQAEERSRFFGAPGLMFLQTLWMSNLFLIAGCAVSYFVSAITEEKEEDTLGLMRMTGLTGLAILLGKFGSRLAQVLCLALLQLPFALLTVTLGGVTLDQVFAMIAALLSLIWATAALALLMSVVSPNTRQAAARMSLLIVVYVVGDWVLSDFLAWVGFTAPEPFVIRSLHILDDALLATRMQDGTSSATTPAFVSAFEVLNLSVGLVAFLLAWALFAWGAELGQGLTEKRGLWEFRWRGRRWLHPGRVWPRYLFWKEYHFLLGGWPWLILKFVAYGLGAILIAWYNAPMGLFTLFIDMDYQGRMVASILTMFGSFGLTIEGARLASRMYSEELRQQTWSTLAGLPGEVERLAYRKAAAALLGLVPLLSWWLAIIFLTPAGREMFVEITDDMMLWGLMGAFMLIPHVAALLSLYLRWGAVPLSFAVVWVPMFCVLAMNFGSGEDVAGAIFLLGSIVGIVFCHAMIGRRLHELAAE